MYIYFILRSLESYDDSSIGMCESRLHMGATSQHDTPTYIC